MLRRSPRAVLLWAAAAVVAIVTTASVGSTLASLHRQDSRYGRPRAVVVAAHDLALSTVVGRSDVREVKVRGQGVPRDAIATAAGAVGRAIAVPVLSGSAVTNRHVTGPVRDGRDGVVPPGRRAMRIVVANGLRPRPGDIVDVFVTFPAGSVPADTDPTLTVAERVPVVAVDTGTEPSEAGAHPERVGVTLLVPSEHAKRLAYAAATGTVALATTPPEDAPAVPLPG
jgi:Flp pilus assembly protein CpaB